MKDIFANLFLAYRAEHIKLKGTAFYIVSAIFGAVIPILYFIIMTFAPDIPSESAPHNYYLKAFYEVLTPYCNFFFPLLIVIMVSRITQFDHKNGGWQLMETQPLRKTSIYLSKFLVLLTACVLSIIVLMATSYLFSWILSLIKDIPKSAIVTFEALALFKIFTRLLIASLFLVAFQYFISVLIPSFIWSILIGFAGMLAFLFLLGFQIAPAWLPYEIVSRVSRFHDGSDFGHLFLYTEVLSVLFTIIILYLGFQWYSHKQLKLAFLRSKGALFIATTIVIVIGALIFFLLMPNATKFHNRTVISGTLKTDARISTIYVKGLVDTLAVIPVRDSVFKTVIPGKMLFGQYRLLFDRSFQLPIFMGEHDSTALEVKFYNNQPDVKVRGTRFAENQSAGNADDFVSYVPYWTEQNVYMDRPDRIADRLHEEWKDEMSKKSKFRTADNYVSKEDFTAKFKKLTTIKLLTYWNDYQKKRAMLYDTVASKIPEKIQELKASVDLQDETMLVETDYLNYVRDELIVNNTADIDLQSKYLQEISKLEKGSFKDNLLYWILAKGIFDAQTEQEISMLAGYANQFENQKYSKIIQANAMLRSGLSRGKTAPYFEGSTPGDATISLKDLEGKLTVIDVWATWCGPCWQQSPYFEKFALKYKNEAIQFVALSTDQNRAAWLVEAKAKSKSVMQLHANNSNEFAGRYDLQTIPRFILIDAAGKILNASLPPPSESAFEIILRKELGLSEE